MALREPGLQQAQSGPPSESSHTNNFGSFSINGGVNFFGGQFIDSGGPRSFTGHVHGIGAAFDNRVEALLRSLAFPEEWSRFEQIRDIFGTTYEWIFDPAGQKIPDSALQLSSLTKEQVRDVNFVDWLRKDGTIFWICGKAGSGKSTLMKFMVDSNQLHTHLREWSGDGELLTPCYFFWRAGTPEQKNFSGLVRSLLGQIIKNFPALATCADELTNKPTGSWSLKRSSAALLQTLKRSQASFCFLIDGLDEFVGDEESQDNMIRLIQDMAGLPNVKACVSSRPEVFFVDTFGDMEKLELQTLTYADLRMTAEGRLRLQRRFREQESEQGGLAADLIDTLCAKAEGVFLWLHLATEDVIRGIKRHETLEESLARVHALGSNLNELFNDLLDRVDLFHRRQTAQVVRIMSCFELDTNQWEWSASSDFIRLGGMSVLLTAAHVSPRLMDPLWEASVEDLASAFGPSTGCFDQLKRFGFNISEYSMGLLETFFARAPRCSSTNLDSCTCGPQAASFRLYKLLYHFQIQGVRFIHRSAYEFFSDNENGGHFLEKYATPISQSPGPCIDSLKLLYRLSLRSFCAFTSSLSAQLPPELDQYETLALRDCAERIQDSYADFHLPLSALQSAAEALTSLLPADKQLRFPYQSTAAYSYDAICAISAKEKDLLLYAFENMHAYYGRLLAILHDLRQRPIHEAVVEESAFYLTKKLFGAKSGLIDIRKSDIRLTLDSLKGDIESMLGDADEWRLLVNIQDKASAASRAQFCTLMNIRGGRFAGEAALRICNAVLGGAKVKECLEEGKTYTTAPATPKPFRLGLWALKCLQTMLSLSNRCTACDRTRILSAIESFLTEDVDKMTAVVSLTRFSTSDADSLYIRLEASLSTLVEDILRLDDACLQRISKALDLQGLPRKFIHDVLIIPEAASTGEVQRLLNSAWLPRLGEAADQDKLDELVLNLLRSLGVATPDSNHGPAASDLVKFLEDRGRVVTYGEDEYSAL